MLRSLLVGSVLVVLLAVVGNASGGGTGWPQPDARDKALLASVLHGMHTDLGTVRLEQLPAAWRHGRRAETLELVTKTAVSRKQTVRSIRADWDTLLIAHAYNERCVRAGAHCVAVYVGPTGGGGAGRSGVKRPLWSAYALARAIRRRFAAVHLKVISISFEHPYAFAPIVSIRSSHPWRAMKAENKARVALLPALGHSEGSFVAMYDAHGRVFLVSAGSGNTGEGWCAPGLHCPAP